MHAALSASCRRTCSLLRHSPASQASFVPVTETVAAFKALCDGEYDHLPEQAFFMWRYRRPRTQRSEAGRQVVMADPFEVQLVATDREVWTARRPLFPF